MWAGQKRLGQVSSWHDSEAMECCSLSFLVGVGGRRDRKYLFFYWKMALLGVVASISVLRRQREEDCHRFEARQAPYSQRSWDTVLCKSTHEVLVLNAIYLVSWASGLWVAHMLMLDTEVGAGNQTLASYLPGKHLTQWLSSPPPEKYSLGGRPSMWRPSLPPYWAFSFQSLFLPLFCVWESNQIPSL